MRARREVRTRPADLAVSRVVSGTAGGGGAVCSEQHPEHGHGGAGPALGSHYCILFWLMRMTVHRPSCLILVPTRGAARSSVHANGLPAPPDWPGLLEPRRSPVSCDLQFYCEPFWFVGEPDHLSNCADDRVPNSGGYLPWTDCWLLYWKLST